MTSKKFIKDIDNTFKECLEIVKKKNSDYSGNGSPFKTFKACEYIGVSPEKAILTRVMEKISRVTVLLDNKKPKVKDEKIEDTLMDIINYIAILKALIKE